MEALLWRLVGVAILMGAGAWGGYKATAAVYEPKVAALEQKVTTAEARADSFEKSYNGLATATKKQNESIAKTVADAKEREAQAAIAIKKAKADSDNYQAKAAAVLLSEPPVGVSECTAAQAVFDAELKDERGK